MGSSCFGSCPNYKKDSRVRILISVKLLKDIKGIKGIKGMVNNTLKILDEGQIKMCPECIQMKKPQYYYDFEQEICNMNLCFMNKEISGKAYTEHAQKRTDTEGMRLTYEGYVNACKNYEQNEILFSYLWDKCLDVNKYNTNKICKYYNIIPFTPSVMINISPDWKVGDRRTDTCKIKILRTIFENYMKEGWYDKWEYIIENGSEGSHIHLHAVCHMNPQRLKSTETHLKKGNHTQQLIKHGKSIKGMEGIIKGVGVQKTFLRTEQIVKDKCDYLHEEKKPYGHTNKSVICDVTHGCL